MNFKVIIEQDEKGFFVAWVPAVPGCHSQGETYEKALANVKEAIELCLEVARTDSAYKGKIDFNRENFVSRFLGIAEIPVQFQPS